MSLFWQESMLVAPKLQPEFFSSLEREYLPPARDIGLQPVGCWRLSSTKGDAAEVVLIWEIGDWARFKALSAALRPSAETSRLRAWHEKSNTWARERSGMLLKQVASPEALARYYKESMSTRFVFHETMHIEPNKEAEYVRGMEIQLGGSFLENGYRMIGEFKPLLRSGRIINLWAVERGFDSMNAVGSADRNADEFYSHGYWMEMGLALRKHWRSVWMVPVPLDLTAR
jgi:hypothetical protein